MTNAEVLYNRMRYVFTFHETLLCPKIFRCIPILCVKTFKTDTLLTLLNQNSYFEVMLVVKLYKSIAFTELNSKKSLVILSLFHFLCFSTFSVM